MTSPARKINGHDHAFELAPGPMDPERLAKLREMLADGWLIPSQIGRGYVFELLAAHEHHSQRAAQLEAVNNALTNTTMGRAMECIEALKARVSMLEERTCVEGEDVDREGATRSKLEAWLSKHPEWVRVPDTQTRGSLWRREGKRAVLLGDGSEALAYAIEELAIADLRSGWDILAEIAAIELPKTTNN